MNFSKNATIIRWILIALSFIVVTAILWNTFDFFKKFKQEERNKMMIHGETLKAFAKDVDNNSGYPIFKKIINTNKDLSKAEKVALLKEGKTIFERNVFTGDYNLHSLIISSNTDIPIILTDEKGKIESTINLDSIKEKDSIYRYKQLEIMKSQNKPIVLNYKVDKKNVTKKVFYKDSALLTKLKYYPLALLLILALFTAVIYLVLKSSKVAEQNKLWTGMAKETAHQIGTPLSSLLGWVEILRMDNAEESTVVEIEKDIHRLNTIADRFSKIGSIPKLEKLNIVSEVKSSFNYLKSRSSKQIDFSFDTNSNDIKVNANKQLLSWVIENIIKNAIDAMQGKGKLDLFIINEQNLVKIIVCDSGKGIPKNQFKKIFETGFTTKKRGWGLGLSLAKRIVEDYHHGRIYVKKSTVGKGTCMAISLKKIV